MPLAGRSAIIIWNDIAPEGRTDFYDWHIREHIPERVAIPGFLRGSRYRAAVGGRSPEFLTLYETVDADVATSAPYLARLNAPTAWTKRATAHFRNTSRALTQVVFSVGAGRGGIVATIQFVDSPNSRRAFAALVAQSSMLIELAAASRLSGIHICQTNVAASAAKTTESKDRSDIQSAPIGAVLIEGCDLNAVESAVAEFGRITQTASSDTVHGIYQIEHSLDRPV
jgi:hypothetical protein